MTLFFTIYLIELNNLMTNVLRIYIKFIIIFVLKTFEINITVYERKIILYRKDLEIIPLNPLLWER